LPGHTNPIWSVVFLPDGKEVISGCADGNIRGWRVDDGCEVGKGRKGMWENSIVYAIVASSDGQWIATGGEEQHVTIWNTTTCEKVFELEGHTDEVRSLAFSQDSARLASGSKDQTVIVWNTTTGERLLGPLTGHTTRSVWCVAFSPNGDKITVFYFNCADWKPHTELVHSITISPNGKFIASASYDKTVRLWDMMASTSVGPALECDDEVYSVAISPSGSHLASGGRDRKVRIW
ncbi:hypothetical protein PAXINDRAFT_42507, partial [Paxillus involutus ATCC 200175]